MSNETKEQDAKKFGKISHNNPLPVIQQIVRFVKQFGNQVEIIIEVVRKFTGMSFDIVMFMILNEISEKEFGKFDKYIND